MMVIRKLLSLLSARAKGRLLLLLVVLIGSAIVEAAGIASILPFMTLVIRPNAIQETPVLMGLYNDLGFQNERSFLTAVGLAVLVLLVLTNLGKTLATWFTLKFQNRQAFELSERLLTSYMRRPYEFFLGKNSSDLAGVILFDANGVIERVLRPVIDIASGATVALAIMALLVIVDPLMALTIAGFIGGSYAAVYVVVNRKLKEYGHQQVESNAQKVRSVSEALGAIKVLKLLGREQTFLSRFSYHAERLNRNTASAGAIGQLPRFAVEIVCFGGILLLVIHFINRENEAAGVIPILAMYVFAGYRLLPTLQQVFNSFVILGYNTASLDVVHAELLKCDEPPLEPMSVGRPRSSRNSAAAAKAQRQTLELRGVSFKYASAATPALRNLNLTIQPRTLVGIVGPTGGGKTTAVDLILGLLSPTQGSILLDGVPMSDDDRREWQRKVGYIPQSIYISDDTAARNIAFGVPDEEIDMEAVRRAARIANIEEFIETELPCGYDTKIGEDGMRLSGGQRQRIGIARAMYAGPQVLVMDEATSALDGVTEEGVMAAVRSISEGITVIMIAHRLSTVRDCDVIYQLDRGSIETSGTYEDLMRSSDWFREAAGGVA